MKIARYTRELVNTERRLLRLLSRTPLSEIDLVMRLWPSTKQPHKKQKTIRRYLESLQRTGKCKGAMGIWWIPGGGRPGGKKVRMAA